MQRQRQSIIAMKASIARQSRSLLKKAEAHPSNGFFVLPPPAGGPPYAAERECPPLPADEVDQLVKHAGAASSVSPDLLRSVMKEESGFRPCAVSGKGAMGLMQLMQSTADDFGVRDAFNSQENVTAGAKFLRQLINLYNGDLALALSAYNAGPRRVDPSMGIPAIPQTMEYVNRVLSVLPISELSGSGD